MIQPAEFSDYCIKLDPHTSIDIPDYYIPVHHYCATLGHKVNTVMRIMISYLRTLVNLPFCSLVQTQGQSGASIGRLTN